METREVEQGHLTPECWNVQVWGTEKCQTCEFLDTEECGGVEIRRTGKNSSGFSVPIGKAV